MGSISRASLQLIDNLSRITGRRFEVTLDESLRIRVTCPESLTVDETRFCAELEDLLRRNEDSSTAIVSLREDLRLAELRNQELVQQNRTLAEMATRDLLTGLYTRWFVKDKINQELQRSQRHEFPMSVLMIDVDHFKDVNDSYGHLIGDEVLRDMGRIIRESLRAYDIPGRYGGEEFCLMLPSTEVDNTMVVAERIRERIQDNTIRSTASPFHVTASIGVAGVAGEHGIQDAEDLIELADKALYRAKHSGRNRVELWETN